MAHRALLVGILALGVIAWTSASDVAPASANATVRQPAADRTRCCVLQLNRLTIDKSALLINSFILHQRLICRTRDQQSRKSVLAQSHGTASHAAGRQSLHSAMQAALAYSLNKARRMEQMTELEVLAQALTKQ
jgi:hypothetical protein